MIEIILEKCDQCGTCVGVCPQDAISRELTGYYINPETCIYCHHCIVVCPLDAIREKEFHAASQL